MIDTFVPVSPFVPRLSHFHGCGPACWGLFVVVVFVAASRQLFVVFVASFATSPSLSHVRTFLAFLLARICLSPKNFSLHNAFFASYLHIDMQFFV